MSGKMSRTKGAVAERELFKLIGLEFGISVQRNLLQTREGGSDTSVGEWAIEVKRQETFSFDAWWAQSVDQAKRAGKRPMLAYRKSHQPWRFRISARDYLDMHDSGCNTWHIPESTVLDIDIKEAFRLIGDSL
jgi:Holliday junction resolvase